MQLIIRLTQRFIPACLLFGSAAVTLFLVSWVLWLMRFGFEFTDESYYLISIADAFRYPVTLTQFGFFYRPLYWLVDGNIVLLRQVNFLFTFGLATWFAQHFLRVQFAAQRIAPYVRWILAMGLACGTLVFLRLWLPTPSYNWLAFQALLVAGSAALLAQKRWTKESIIGWILIGVAGWMAFLAKPSTAAALAVSVGFYLLVSGKIYARGWLIAAASAVILLLLTALMIDGSLMVFIARINHGMELTHMMGSHDYGALFKIDTYGLDAILLKWMRRGIFLSLIVALLLSGRHPLFILLGTALMSSCFAATLLIATEYVKLGLAQYGFYQLLLWMAAYGALVISLCKLRIIGLKRLARKDCALALLLVLFPYVFAFGSSNNYWWMGGLTSLFWVFAGLVFLTPIPPMERFWGLVLPLTGAVQIVAAGVLTLGILVPYYQTQLVYKNTHVTNIGAEEAQVILVPSFGEYLDEVRRKSTAAGFVEGTPVLDLTGHFPGVIHAIGGINLSQPWVIGSYDGYHGHLAVAQDHLRRVSCAEFARAWMFTEPTGKVPMEPKLLQVLGAELTRDYAKVTQFNTVKGLGGFDEIHAQYLWKPKRLEKAAIDACEKAKAGS